MKILYVEDELGKNIPQIAHLFSKYLDRESVEKLEELQAEEHRYGAEPEAIKSVLEESNLIQVEYRFPNALHKVIHHFEDYALFIVDRNLVESEYYFEEVRGIDSDYGELQYDEFFEREGEYLFCKLALSQNIDLSSRFYCLTAQTPEESRFRGREVMETLISLNKFSSKNLIRKGNNHDFKRLRQVIENIEILGLQNENEHYLRILRENIGERGSQKFLYLLSHKDSAEEAVIAGNLGILRNILGRMLTEVGKRLEAPPPCWNKEGHTLIVSNFLWWLTHDEVTHSINYKFGTNGLLRNFFNGIYLISSVFTAFEGSVGKPPGYQPTANTVNSLVYALKDVILWFKQICHKY